MATEPAAIEGPTPSEPEVTSEPAVAAEPEVAPAEPEVVADGQDQESVTEPTSEPVAAPPAFDLSDPDIAFIVEKYGSDPNELARQLHAANNRNAEQARQEPTTLAQEEPSQSVDLPADVEQAVWREVHNDQECVGLKEDYEEVKGQIREIAQLNRRGELVGGELLTVDRNVTQLENEIRGMKVLLDGKGRLELDEFQKTSLRESIGQMKEELADLKDRRAGMVSTFENLRTKAKGHADAYQRRYDAYRDRITRRFQDAKTQREEKQIISGMAANFAKEWNAALPQVFAALKIPNDPKLRARLNEKVKRAARLEVLSRPIPDGGARKFIEDTLREELQDAETWKRQGAGDYAGMKRNDSRPQAPSGKAAVVPPDGSQSTDWKDRFRANATIAKEKLRALSAKTVFERATGRPTV